MGLDMYLTAEKYISGYSEQTKRDIALEGLEGDHPPTKPDTSVTITLDLAYWRKANQIHQWFVNEVQNGEDDCGDYYVSREQLIELRDLCQQVLDNPEDAEELLPTQGGFFFGSTEFDEWYLASLKDTTEILDRILNNEKFAEWDFKYTSSW